MAEAAQMKLEKVEVDHNEAVVTLRGKVTEGLARCILIAREAEDEAFTVVFVPETLNVDPKAAKLDELRSRASQTSVHQALDERLRGVGPKEK